MKNFAFVILSLLMGLMVSCTNSEGSEAETESEGLPNIVVIYCDDLGYGDLACFGNEVIRTPNIDRMASDGMKFTEFYSASPVCSPSRAALLTGRIPQRMGINSVFFPRSYTGMPLEEITTADAAERWLSEFLAQRRSASQNAPRSPPSNAPGPASTYYDPPTSKPLPRAV